MTNQLLAEYRPWLRKVAAGMTSPGLAEDLAQKGWIALWRAHKSYDGRAPLDWWLKDKAVKRMQTCVSRDWKTIKATQDQASGLPGIGNSDSSWSYSVWDQLSVDLGNIEMAYHRGQVYEALNALTPREREYVFLRFWCGWKLPQMRSHFGYEPSGLWRTSKAKLIEKLDHLIPAQ